MVDRSELDKALDKGSHDRLPPNIPPGFMGEIGPDFRRVDDFKPTLNAGVSQESTWETRVLTIALFYMLVVTSPAALYLLWRNRTWSVRAKALWTVLMVAGYVGFVLLVRRVT